MKRMSRRKMLATTGGLMTAAAVARAQQDVPQPRRPGEAARTPVPATSSETSRILICSCRPLPIRGTLPNLRFSFSDAHSRLTLRRLDSSGDRAGARRLDDHRRREHAPECRRCAGAALAQGRRMGLHAVRQRADHGHRCAGPELRRRRRRRRFVVLRVRHSALDPGTRSGRLRVPAGVRRRRLRRGQHLPDQRLVQAHAERRAGQEFRRAGLVVRPHARPRRHCISSRPLYRDRSTPTGFPAQPRCRRVSATG